MLDLHGKANVFGELACLVLLFILKSGMIYRDKSEENKALARLIYADIIYIVNEIVWQFMNGKEFAFDVELNYISNILTNVFIANLGLMYYRYLYFVMTGRKAKGFMVYIPAMILCFFAISTVKTGWFFYITPENVYTRGKYYHSCYLFSYSYIAIITIQAIRRVLKEKNEYLRRRFIIVASFAICPVLFSVAQAFMPGLALIPYGITLAIVSVFVRLQKQSITASIEHQKISRENIIRYRNTVLSNAIQYMVVNLSKNIIEEITVPADDSISLETIIQSGKISSNNYHEMVKYWNENIIGISDKENQMLFQSDVLIDRYWGGETLISEEIQVRKKDGSVGWIKQDFVIAKNQYTGDILATMTTYDITKEKRYEKAYDEQRTIIEALAFGTTSYWIFDIET